MISRRIARVVALGAALALALSACGGTSKTSPVTDRAPAKGGTLKLVAAGGTTGLDPARAGTPYELMLFRVTTRTLMSYAPIPNENRLVPDLATRPPSVSSDGLLYTFELRDDVRFEPSVAGGRAVTSKDIRYAIERAFYPSVASPVARSVFFDLFAGDEAFMEAPAPGTHITGIELPNDRAIRFRLKRPTGDLPARLAMPIAAPVPEEYAKPFDASARSTYGERFASSGPYMLERDGSGAATGYTPGENITLVRNGSWKPETDQIRKAYPDRIEVEEGVDDVERAARGILDGTWDYNADFRPAQTRIEDVRNSPRLSDRIFVNPGNCVRYIALNTSVAPFDNLKVRRAFAMVLDRKALRDAVGGKTAGDPATHMLLPGMDGFKEAGGRQYDPYESDGARGSLARATELMREAGFPSGRYEATERYPRPEPVLMVTADAPTSIAVADVVAAALGQIGIQVRREAYKSNVMFTEHVQVVDREVAVAPNVGWCSSYPDPSTVFVPLFDGRKITPEGNTNVTQTNDEPLNALLDRAQAARDGNRARLWAEVNRKVMDLSTAVPWLWENTASLISSKVVNFQYLTATWSMDLAVVAVRAAAKE